MEEILPASLHDVTELNALINAAYRGETAKKGWTHESDLLDGIRVDENELTRLIEDKNISILKFVIDQQIAGCVLLEQKKDYIYLGMLTVNPLLQQKGIGKKLLLASEDYARSKNCSTIKMTVISVRTELINWYEKFGYRSTGQKRSFISIDGKFGIPKTDLQMIIMSKNV